MKTINSIKVVGIDYVPVKVECEITPGIGIHLVGLADVAVKESLLRTVTAMQACGYRIPGKKIVINLAPADLCKRGSHYDLPIALAILGASGQKQLVDADKYVIAGQLCLDGSLRDIPGWMQAAELAKSTGRACILPTESAKLAAAALGPEPKIYGADDLQEVIDILVDGAPEWTASDECQTIYSENQPPEPRPVWDEIVGHESAKRALEIAAAGGHPILMVGDGASSRRLAFALREILPPMTREEALEVQRICSVSGRRHNPDLRMFESIDPTMSMATMFGGGSGENVLPGKVSLAHNGVLFVDDTLLLPSVYQQMMQTVLEDGKVTISRLKNKVDFPARFFPVFAMRPCPCGYYGEGDRCTCTPTQRKNYLAKLSGPIYDRLTMQVWVHAEPTTGEVAESKRDGETAEAHRRGGELQVFR